MPVQVAISINGRPISEWMVGRVSGGTHPDDINLYAIFPARDSRVTQAEIDAAPKVTHRYGDGVEALVARSMAVISGFGKTPPEHS